MGKGEFAPALDQFLLLPQCFLPLLRTFRYSHHNNEALHQVIKNNRVSLKIDNQSNLLDIFTADLKLPSHSCNRVNLSVFQVQTSVTLLIRTYF